VPRAISPVIDLQRGANVTQRIAKDHGPRCVCAIFFGSSGTGGDFFFGFTALARA